MIVDTRTIPPEGLLLENGEDRDVFQLHEEGVSSSSPLRYRLKATVQPSELLLEGWIEADFELRCVRCLEGFRRTLRLDPYALFHRVEKPGIQDLTDRLREDILLDLPGYPRCDQADSPRECQAPAHFSTESGDRPARKPEGGKGVWNALDDLETNADEKPTDS